MVPKRSLTIRKVPPLMVLRTINIRPPDTTVSKTQQYQDQNQVVKRRVFLGEDLNTMVKEQHK